ncbi:hypothetical protein [Saccharothrix sp. HUAS TT1]|uniref:hypothetical protein n=1 Tax=unclassified Saccharothrix TaxID=2593673 RepID=UPI00345B901C
MTDLDLPPSSPLPDGVRDAALTRLRAGLDAPPPRRLPLKVAAVAVVVAASATLAVRFADPGEPTAATSSSPSPIPELGHYDAAAHYDLRTGSAPDGAAERCHARTTGLPPVQQWTAIVTATWSRVDLTAFGTPAGIVFCETTPGSVTVSSPQADPGALAVSFTTANGSMAGFNGPDPRSYTLAARDEEGERDVVARSGRLFLLPNGFVADRVIAQPEVASSDELVQRFELTAPPPSRAVVDRPAAPEDRTSPEGRRLAACLADQPRPIADPDAWRTGQAVALTATESLQLGHYRDLLLVCRQDRSVEVHDLRGAGVLSAPGALTRGATLRGAWVFYDLTPTTEGGEAHFSSNEQALVAEITDERVASVTLAGPGRPDVTVEPVMGSVVLPGHELPAEGPGQVRVIVRDASGAVLEELHRES